MPFKQTPKNWKQNDGKSNDFFCFYKSKVNIAAVFKAKSFQLYKRDSLDNYVEFNPPSSRNKV